ncbi:GTP-binding protein [Fertoebacter nigrum]|uniref:GTP-binding protein n=1 Tax=Fertoeibacter niger TaxID=2656921 RepID=A0A8X8GWW9_9RHOB|nr:GTP-binding protein [Fertoeibacter niger]NUB45849.1 GTP-binding protein [Fertoeibacter niger]
MVPVAVITGFLGAGKTTLLGHMLHHAQGRRYAVIVNEFAAAGIDAELLDSGAEDLIEMNNGCLCCTVRGDLIRTLHGLLPRLAGFDGVIIETSGLAAPGPVAQTFLIDETLRAHLALDSITTVVDALHLLDQLHAQAEVHDQIAFADQIVLNKTDLVRPAALAALEGRLRQMNPFAPVLRAVRAEVPPDALFGRGGFDLDRLAALLADQPPAHDHHHGHHDHHHHDGHDHDHDHGSITSVVLHSAAVMDAGRLGDWLAGHLADHGRDLLRGKGIIHVAGDDRRLALQSVHMMLEGAFIGPWPPGPRLSRLVLIGRNLDGPALQSAFESCAA